MKKLNLLWIIGLIFIVMSSSVFAILGTTEYRTDVAQKLNSGANGWFAKYLYGVNLTGANHITVRWINAIQTNFDINLTVGCMGATLGWSIGSEYVTAGPFTQSDTIEHIYNFTDVSNLTNQNCKVVFRIDSINGGVNIIRIGYDALAEPGPNESWNSHAGGKTNDSATRRLDMSINVSQGAVPGPGDPVVVLLTPPDDSVNKSTVNFSYSGYVDVGTPKNASLWSNFTGTFQYNHSNQSILINDTTNYFININLTTGYYIWNVQMCDTTGNCSFYVTKNFTLIIDTTKPIITPEPNLPINKTYIINGTLTTYINFSDEREIYSINVTLGNGTEIFGDTNIGVSFYQLNISRIIAEAGIGNVTARICDAHTNSLIKDIENKVENQGIKYVMKRKFIFIDKEWVRIYPKDFLNYNTPSTLKQDNRYSFTFNKKTTPNIETFIVESSHYIDINKNQYYGGHLIIPGINNGYWIDFENSEATKYKIKRISDKKIEVTIYGLKNKQITFNSVGELNCEEKTYHFLNLNPTEAFTSDILVNENSTFYLNISEHPTFDLTINATLNYNDTNFNVGTTSNFSQLITAPSTVSGNLENISFLWILNIDGTDNNLTEHNQTVGDFFLDNCTNASTQTLNFSIIDEDTEASIAADITGTFNYSLNEIFKTFDLTSPDRNTTQMCIFPSRATFTDDYSLLYEATDYPQRGFSDRGIVLTNISVDIPLYLLHIDEGIFGRFRIVDSFERSLSGVRGVMERTIGGSTVTIEIEESDDSGLMTFWLDPDVTYTFTFSLTGFETESFSLRVTTGEIFTVTLRGGISVTNNQSFETGIISSFSPSNIILQNNTNYTFMFNMTSSYWTVTDCTLFIQNGSTVLASSSASFDSDSCDISIIYNTSGLDTIISKAVYSLNGTEISKQREYRVRYTYEGEFSLKNLIDDLKAFGQAGFNDFTRIIIAFIIITSIIASLSIKAGLREPISMTILTLALVWFFSYIGWMTISYDSIPNEWLKQYILAILLSLIGGSYLFNEVSR